uniref:F-BAR domain-containing protein n=1 Tax=Parastrongyloides trichosuri TaxID=131310 RepID=A0A0N4ZHK9_PARTI
MNSLKKRNIPNDFHHNVKGIKQKMDDQMRCFYHRGNIQMSLLNDISEFLKKRNQLDMEYSKNLEKLASSYTRHMEREKDKGKSSEKENYSQYDLLRLLVDNTKNEANLRNEAVKYINDVITPLISSRQETTVNMVKNVNQIAITAQNEIFRVVEELYTAMKIYSKNAELYNTAKHKLKNAQEQMEKATNSSSKKKQSDAKKYLEKRQNKYDSIKLQCDRSRNEYILCVKAANAAMTKYYNDDISDLMDCSDLGTHHWLYKIVEALGMHKNYIVSQDIKSKDNLIKFADDLDLKKDKAKFLRLNNNAFMHPIPFKFKKEYDDDIENIVGDHNLMAELTQRHSQIKKRLTDLYVETEDTWNCLQQLELHILKMSYIPSPEENITNFTICRGFIELEKENNNNEDNNGEPVDLAQATDLYVNYFMHHLLNGNVINRLQARSEGIQNALLQSIDSLESDCSQEAMYIRILAKNEEENKNGGGPMTPRQQHRRRIGSLIVGEYVPRLFGGTVEEYCFIKGCLIPPIIITCVEAIRDNALDMQGIFRISATNGDILALRDEFEKGNNPLKSGIKSSDIHAICGILKLYLRELREPMIPFSMFDYCVESWKTNNMDQFLECIKKIFFDLPQPVWLTLRYLFAFFDHICEHNANNCMDAHNLSICLGPAMLPIPEGRDPILYHNFVNDFLKCVIMKHKKIFSEFTPGPIYTKESTIYRINSINEHGHIESDEDNHLQHSPDKTSTTNDKGDSGVSKITFNSSNDSKNRTPSDFTENNSIESEHYIQSDTSDLDMNVSHFDRSMPINMNLGIIDAVHTLTPLDELSPSVASDNRSSIWTRRTTSINNINLQNKNSNIINLNCNEKDVEKNSSIIQVPYMLPNKTSVSELEEAIKRLASMDSDDAISCLDVQCINENTNTTRANY